MKKTYIILAAMLCTLVSCDLTETQQATADRAMIFGSEDGLEVYTNSFYNHLPDRDAAFKMDATTDYGAKNAVGTYECSAYTIETSTSWSWGNLRNYNYFIKHNTNPAVSETVRNSYTGIARLFRAYFYFDKLVQYGEVPWIENLLEPDSEELYAPRDTRDVIITKMIEDLDFAYNHITESKITSNSNTVNKWTALLLKSRVCLFEASWRKYHAGTDYVKNCAIKADDLFAQAAAAAKELMDKGPYKIHMSGNVYEAGGRGAYRDLFVSDNTVTEEVMLAVSTDAKLGLGEQNWWYNSSTYGPHLCMTRTFAKTYLNSDGTFYNEKKADGSYKNFVEETTGRDARLCQTIRGADYTCKDARGAYIRTAANFTGHTLTGYQFTKYVMDDVACDDGAKNINDIPLFRYAEALLNYAEAQAELGKLTDADWAATIGLLRKRAGITGSTLTSKPTQVDPYLQRTYFPNISDPVLLEIRRERAIELCLEGMRMIDLKRWACGALWKTAEWTGIYVPAMNQRLDINGDGEYDVYFTEDKKYLTEGEYRNLAVLVDKTATLRKLNDDPAGGYIMFYNETSHDWEDNMYLYPIPKQVRAKNPNLTQNPGW